MFSCHAIIECYGRQAFLNAEQLMELMCLAARDAGATVIAQHGHSFGGGGGHTAVVLLAESHITVHTWPEYSYAAFDIFMCGEHTDVSAAVNRIVTFDPDGNCETKIFHRGEAISPNMGGDFLQKSTSQ